MASFADAPAGDLAVGEKIFKTKCAQCHVAEKGGGHKQVHTMPICGVA
jgi:cytochrome c